ncbi:MAG: LytR family transcriptional regulator [Glaciihabitans sp.]|jgi:LCP family protein required for cell wall assembly|nr:LytR family transcriptional regulator [Glaciihabitans sp.]
MSDQSSRPGGSSPVVGIARHGRLRKSGPLSAIFSTLAAFVAVVIVASLAITSYATYNLVAQAGKNAVNIHPGESPAPPPGVGAYPGGFNILLVGDDTRTGQHGIGAGLNDSGSLNDVTILLHVSGDHTFATAVSFPRDMIVPHPQCPKGGTSVGLPVNTALSYGGLPCVVDVIQALTGLKIQFAGLITFNGVIEMSNAVGGVNVCVSGNLNDKEVGLHLKSGMHLLSGLTALEFLRSRHGVGDGSDLGRISSQQVYLSALVRTLESSGTLSNPTTVYKIASAAIKNMQLSSSLDQPVTMIAIAQALKNIPLSRVQFVQYPGSTGGTGIFSGKVQPNVALGNQLFSLIRADKPFRLGAQGFNRGSVPNTGKTTTATSTPAPTSTGSSGAPETVIDGLVGQSAAQQTCSKANKFNGQG